MNWFTRVSGPSPAQGGDESSRPEPVKKGFFQGLRKIFVKKDSKGDSISEISQSTMSSQPVNIEGSNFKKWKPEVLSTDSTSTRSSMSESSEISPKTEADSLLTSVSSSSTNTVSDNSSDSVPKTQASTSSKVHSIGIFQGVYDLATKENLTGSEKEFLILKLMTIHGDSYLSSMLADSSAFDAVMGFLEKEGIKDLSGIKDSLIFKKAMANINEYSDLNPKNKESANTLSTQSILKLFSLLDNGKVQWTLYEVSKGLKDKEEIAAKTQDPISKMYKLFMSGNLEKTKWRLEGFKKEYPTKIAKEIFTEYSKLSSADKKKLENDKLFKSHLDSLLESLDPNVKSLAQDFLDGKIKVEVLLSRL